MGEVRGSTRRINFQSPTLFQPHRDSDSGQVKVGSNALRHLPDHSMAPRTRHNVEDAEPVPEVDMSRKLTCLLDGDPDLFSVQTAGNERIFNLKDLIHAKAIDFSERGTLARKLILLKVNIPWSLARVRC